MKMSFGQYRRASALLTGVLCLLAAPARASGRLIDLGKSKILVRHSLCTITATP